MVSYRPAGSSFGSSSGSKLTFPHLNLEGQYIRSSCKALRTCRPGSSDEVQGGIRWGGSRRGDTRCSLRSADYPNDDLKTHRPRPRSTYKHNRTRTLVGSRTQSMILGQLSWTSWQLRMYVTYIRTFRTVPAYRPFQPMSAGREHRGRYATFRHQEYDPASVLAARLV